MQQHLIGGLLTLPKVTFSLIYIDADKTAADYWTGGNDIESEGNFKWIGSEQPFTYTNWMTGQPDPAEQDCVEIRGVSNFKWHDETCNHSHLFICEKS